jgi:hypothetical protein
MADTRVKIEIDVYTQSQWYNIIRDLNQLFGKNWRGQQRVKRKFTRSTMPLRVWFEVPDEKKASFLQLKYSGLKMPKV